MVSQPNRENAFCRYDGKSLRYPSTIPTAPLAEGYREEPYWWQEAPPVEASPMELPAETDVVIVGGGYTGVVAASELARRGRAVVLLEKHELGWGASTRNGGMVHPGFKVGANTLLRRYGDGGRQLYQASLDAFRLVEQTVQAHNIDCDYRRTGHIAVAFKPGHLARLEGEANVLSNEFGVSARVLDRVALESEIGSSLYHGGLLVEQSGGLHSAKYFAGLCQVACEHGAALFSRRAATSIERDDQAFVVSLDGRRIRARQVLVATDGYTDRLLPGLRRRVVPIGSYMIATEPLPPDLARSAIRKGRMLFDTKNFLYYWRLSNDDRVLFGGRASFASTSMEKARDWLHAAMVSVHPQLRDVKVAYAWGGQVGFTFDWLPHIGRMDGITYAVGYCGTGIAMSTYFGHLAASWIAGEELPGCWRRPFPTLPLYRERAWFLPALGWYLGASDRL